MSMSLTGLCREHSFESASELCRRCGFEYCDSCVVYPFGAKKPLCKTCAIAMSGVRSQTSLPAMPPRIVKKRAKAFAAHRREAVATTGDEATGPKNRDTAEPSPPETTAPAPELAPVPGPAASSAEGDDAIDWSQPFG